MPTNAHAAEPNRVCRGDQISTSDPDAIEAEFLDYDTRSVCMDESSGIENASGTEGEAKAIVTLNYCEHDEPDGSNRCFCYPLFLLDIWVTCT